MSAARLVFVDIVRSMVEKGIDIDALAGEGYQLKAHQEAILHDHFRIVEILLDAGANMKPHDDSSPSSVFRDALRGPKKYDMVKMLIRRGAEVNESFNFRDTVLTSAAFENDYMIVEILLKAGTCVNEVTKYTWTALQASATGGDVDIGQLLIDAGADIDAPTGTTYDEAYEAAIGGEEYESLMTPF